MVKCVTHVVIVKDAVIGSPPHGILHRSLTNQIAIHLLSCNKFISPFLSLLEIQKISFYLCLIIAKADLLPCTQLPLTNRLAITFFSQFAVKTWNTSPIGQSGPTGMQLKIVIQC